ncbi:MAG: SipW-dependent-type signal peptide-containing protein [Haloarculaceae archaeon]
MSEKYELSRRKALAALGTIGVAGAGAGMGTSALFSDEEGFEDNTITAGTLDMAVEGEIVAANDEYESAVADITGNPIEADGAVEVGFQLQDFKPGDWFIVCITVDSVAENPFYLTVHGDPDKYAEKEGANTEPENQEETGSPGSTSATNDRGWESVTATNAELGDKLLTTVWGEWGGTAPSADDDNDPNDGSGDRTDLVSLDGDSNIGGPQKNTFSWQEPDEDGNVPGESDVTYTDIRELYFGEDQDPNNPSSNTVPGSNINNGIASGDGILVGGTNDPLEIGGDPSSDDLLSDPDGDGEGELVLYMLFELPVEVGNEVQGDAVRGNLRFNAEQVRNNSSDPRSGRSS